ncbi:MAG: replicative DNA helicase [bacterium]|nr:replicative DNA helicase [bacterium]
MRGRVPPHNEDAERAVLGALLIAPNRIADVAEFLAPEAFFSKRNGIAYGKLVELADKATAIDLVSLASALKADDTLAQVGGHAYLAELTAVVSSAAHVLHHAALVAHTANLRGLIQEATGIIDSAYTAHPDKETLEKLFDESEHRIFKLSEERDRGGAVAMADVLNEAFQRIDAASGRGELTGVPSGFYELDDMLGGFNPGEMTVIAARPSMGKTAFVLNLMEHAASHKPDHFEHMPVVLFFSLEMGRLSICQRMLCSRARVDAHRLRSGKIDRAQYTDLGTAAGELRDMRLLIDDTPGLSIMAIRSRARRVKANKGLDMIVIDYLQLMTAKAESRQQEISLISRSLKELARELEVPVLALSQLSRAVESREDKRPQLSDLRESGSIEQDADVVLMLYRAEYYNQTEENKGKAEVICAKQRNGPTGSAKLQFRGSILRFENPAPSMAEPISLS